MVEALSVLDVPVLSAACLQQFVPSAPVIRMTNIVEAKLAAPLLSRVF